MVGKQSKGEGSVVELPQSHLRDDALSQESELRPRAKPTFRPETALASFTRSFPDTIILSNIIFYITDFITPAQPSLPTPSAKLPGVSERGPLSVTLTPPPNVIAPTFEDSFGGPQ